MDRVCSLSGAPWICSTCRGTSTSTQVQLPLHPIEVCSLLLSTSGFPAPPALQAREAGEEILLWEGKETIHSMEKSKRPHRHILPWGGSFSEQTNLPNQTFVKADAFLQKLQVPTEVLGAYIFFVVFLFFWLGASTQSLDGCLEASCAIFPFIHNCCKQRGQLVNVGGTDAWVCSLHLSCKPRESLGLFPCHGYLYLPPLGSELLCALVIISHY